MGAKRAHAASPYAPPNFQGRIYSDPLLYLVSVNLLRIGGSNPVRGEQPSGLFTSEPERRGLACGSEASSCRIPLCSTKFPGSIILKITELCKHQQPGRLLVVEGVPMSIKVAVSACLLGVPCRYDGGSKPNDEVIQFLKQHKCEVVRICPEVMGGLPIPHPANEIQIVDGYRVVCDVDGNDNTAAFEKGAQKACKRVCDKKCSHANLKAKSPSCGVGEVYDGTFSKTLVSGDGVATSLLRNCDIKLATEKTFKKEFEFDFE